jgi:hypothetical protein
MLQKFKYLTNCVCRRSVGCLDLQIIRADCHHWRLEVGAKLVLEDGEIPFQDPAVFLPEPSTLFHQGGLTDLAVTLATRRASNLSINRAKLWIMENELVLSIFQAFWMRANTDVF